MKRIYQAPGKVVLIGEYAVVDGALAVVAAVDSGVRCVVEPAAERTLEAPGDDRFVRGALQAAQAPPAAYRFSDYNPMPTAEKPGLGGSAAAVVCATLAALSLHGRIAEPYTLLRRSMAVHHAIQGSGSGIDVAASAFGGIMEFRDGIVKPLLIPPFLVVWSGRAARTGPRLERYLAWSQREGFAVISEETVLRFRTDPIGALRESRRLLEYMARQTGIAYRTPALDAIARIAEGFGGAAKPSGAGGGDCAVAILPDPDAEAAFRAACEAAGFPILPLQVATSAKLVLE